jgi:hypothetical protein
MGWHCLYVHYLRFFLCGKFFTKIWYKLYIYTVFIHTFRCGCLCICAMLRWFVTIYACFTCRSMKSTVTNMSRTRMKWSIPTLAENTNSDYNISFKFCLSQIQEKLW